MPTQPYADLGAGAQIDPLAVVGHRYRPDAGRTVLGQNCVVRAYTIIYADVQAGDNLQTGHHVLIREHTVLGDHVVVGSGSVIDGQVTIGSFVKIESRVYIPTHTTIGSFVFIGPGAVLTNDKYPLRRRAEYQPAGPVLEDSVTVGGNATILPGVRIGEGAMVAAGAVVTHHVPPWSLAVGVPARIEPLPEHLIEPNRALSWRKWLDSTNLG